MWVGNFTIKYGCGIDVTRNLNTTIDPTEGTNDNPPPSCGNIAEDTNSNPPLSCGNTTDATDGNPLPSCGNTGDCNSELHEDVTAESNHAAASHQSMTYVCTVNYDKSKNPKGINWIQMTSNTKLLHTNLTTCHRVILHSIQMLWRLLFWLFLHHH